MKQRDHKLGQNMFFGYKIILIIFELYIFFTLVMIYRVDQFRFTYIIFTTKFYIVYRIVLFVQFTRAGYIKE